jgi:predicted phage terminase large subunit-like protein
LARDEFYEFRKLIHPKLKRGWWQQEVSEELQQFYNDYKAGKRPQLVITAPPQHGKSSIINDLLAWIIGKESHINTPLKLIYAAFSDNLSSRANRRIQRIMSLPAYTLAFPNFIPQKATQAQIFWGSGEEGVEDSYFRNTTTGGAITGESLDIGVIDDPVKGREAANSETMREKTWEWYTSDFRSRFSEHGAFLAILTRWHVDDVMGRAIEADPTIKVLRYPAIAEENEKHRARGEPLFPEHKSLEFLQKMEKILSKQAWNSLYQQNPSLAEGNYFKPDRIGGLEAMPGYRMQYVRAWDLAATEDGGDWTVGVKMAFDRQTMRVYITDVVRGQWGPETVREILLSTAKQDGRLVKIRLPQDPGQAGKAQAISLKNLLKEYNVLIETVSGDKATRAEPLADAVNSHQVFIDMDAAWAKPFTDELRTFDSDGGGKHDDQVDAAADAFNHFATSRGILG